MPSKLTTEEFIKRAKQIHGDKYDYSKVDYVKGTEKVCIVCSEHGEFWQIPSSHLMGKGCPRCGGTMKSNTEGFVTKAKRIHGDKYDYTKVEYINSKTKVCIICPEHGEFWQEPHCHLTGQGCPKCKVKKLTERIKATTEEFINKAKSIHGDKYNYSKVDYKGSHKKVCIVCPKHGEFWQIAKSHLIGKGCMRCAAEQRAESRKKPFDEFLVEAKKIHGNNYDYSKMDYQGTHKKVCIVCPEHGEFWQTPKSHLKGCGCQKCYDERRGKTLQHSLDDFITKAKLVHGDRYDYSKVEYVDSTTKVCIICPDHGEFWQAPSHHLSGQGCPKCIRPQSKSEKEIYEFIQSLNIPCEESNRSILNGRKIDIFAPNNSIGVEFDGLYWHNELNKNNNYHLIKTKLCESKGIRLIHIFEDEWIDKKEIWKSMLRNIFSKTENKIYARKCVIKEVAHKNKNDFLNSNHIQGTANSLINLGLYYNDELVSLMTFGKPRINMGGKSEEGVWELVRFCNKLNTSVVGGASKLFKHFVKTYNPNEVISYSDKRWAIGNLYEKLGFAHDHDSRPNYYYVIGCNRENRFKYRKDRLIAEGYDPNKTEHEIMLERKIFRIYDCGTKVWKWKQHE